jgi:hypothetical protein
MTKSKKTHNLSTWIVVAAGLTTITIVGCAGGPLTAILRLRTMRFHGIIRGWLRDLRRLEQRFQGREGRRILRSFRLLATDKGEFSLIL